MRDARSTHAARATGAATLYRAPGYRPTAGTSRPIRPRKPGGLGYRRGMALLADPLTPHSPGLGAHPALCCAWRRCGMSSRRSNGRLPLPCHHLHLSISPSLPSLPSQVPASPSQSCRHVPFRPVCVAMPRHPAPDIPQLGPRNNLGLTASHFQVVYLPRGQMPSRLPCLGRPSTHRVHPIFGGRPSLGTGTIQQTPSSQFPK